MVHDDLDVSKDYCLEKHVGKACIHTVSVGATTVSGLEVSSSRHHLVSFKKKKGRTLISERNNPIGILDNTVSENGHLIANYRNCLKRTVTLDLKYQI